jgi:ABC-2 type transport system permease protein
MFLHLYRYRLKIQLKNKVLLFWTLAFPLILGLFFTAVFSGLDSLDTIEKILVGIVTDETVPTEAADYFFKALNQAKSQNKKLFAPQYLSKKAAEQKLTKNRLSGYYQLTEHSLTLTVNRKGLQQNVLDSFMNSYLQSAETIAILQKENPAVLASSLTKNIGIIHDYTSLKHPAASKGSQKSFYFFTLIGMSCMFGMFWGLMNAHDEQANQSANGMRLCLSPKNKLFVVIANITASFTIFAAEILFVLGFSHFVYGVDFGKRWPLILLTCGITIITALSLGTLLGNLLPISLNQKMSVAVSFQMCCSFLAGMMFSDIKLLMDEYLPWLNAINPVNLVSEALYKLYYYQTLDSFYWNLAGLSILTLIFITVSIILERRVRYVSL